MQISLSPKPGLIRRRGIKLDPARGKGGTRCVNVRTLEVDDYAAFSDHGRYLVRGESRATRALEAAPNAR